MWHNRPLVFFLLPYCGVTYVKIDIVKVIRSILSPAPPPKGGGVGKCMGRFRFNQADWFNDASKRKYICNEHWRNEVKCW